MDERTPEQVNANPLRGDVRTTKHYPPGTPLHEITEFEVWDGTRWVSSSEADKPVRGLIDSSTQDSGQ